MNINLADSGVTTIEGGRGGGTEEGPLVRRGEGLGGGGGIGEGATGAGSFLDIFWLKLYSVRVGL